MPPHKRRGDAGREREGGMGDEKRRERGGKGRGRLSWVVEQMAPKERDESFFKESTEEGEG